MSVRTQEEPEQSEEDLQVMVSVCVQLSLAVVQKEAHLPNPMLESEGTQSVGTVARLRLEARGSTGPAHRIMAAISRGLAEPHVMPARPSHAQRCVCLGPCVLACIVLRVCNPVFVSHFHRWMHRVDSMSNATDAHRQFRSDTCVSMSPNHGEAAVAALDLAAMFEGHAFGFDPHKHHASKVMFDNVGNTNKAFVLARNHNKPKYVQRILLAMERTRREEVECLLALDDTHWPTLAEAVVGMVGRDFAEAPADAFKVMASHWEQFGEAAADLDATHSQQHGARWWESDEVAAAVCASRAAHPVLLQDAKSTGAEVVAASHVVVVEAGDGDSDGDGDGSEPEDSAEVAGESEDQDLSDGDLGSDGDGDGDGDGCGDDGMRTSGFHKNPRNDTRMLRPMSGNLNCDDAVTLIQKVAVRNNLASQARGTEDEPALASELPTGWVSDGSPLAKAMARLLSGEWSEREMNLIMWNGHFHTANRCEVADGSIFGPSVWWPVLRGMGRTPVQTPHILAPRSRRAQCLPLVLHVAKRSAVVWPTNGGQPHSGPVPAPFRPRLLHRTHAYCTLRAGLLCGQAKRNPKGKRPHPKRVLPTGVCRGSVVVQRVCHGLSSSSSSLPSLSSSLSLSVSVAVAVVQLPILSMKHAYVVTASIEGMHPGRLD